MKRVEEDTKEEEEEKEGVTKKKKKISFCNKDSTGPGGRASVMISGCAISIIWANVSERLAEE